MPVAFLRAVNVGGRTVRMEELPGDRMPPYAALLPYGAVGVGIHVLDNAWAAILLYHVGIVVLARHGLRRVRRRPVFRPGVPSIAFLIACLAAGPVVHLLFPWITTSSWDATLGDLGLGGWSWLLFIPYFALVHPILEQVFWREYTRDRAGWLCREDFLFAGYHALVVSLFVTWPWVIVSLLVLVESSMAWRRLRAWSGGLVTPIVTHVAADASIILAAHVVAGM